MEGINKIPEPAIISVDVSEGWDTQSQVEIFLEKIKELPFYNPDLLYSGFDERDIGKNSSATDDGVIYAELEKGFFVNDEDNPFGYALLNEYPVIGIYDPKFLQTAEIGSKDGTVPIPQGYKVKDPRAILAIIKLVGI